jgi:hypothetical protein
MEDSIALRAATWGGQRWLVFASLLIGLWYFTKGSYDTGYLTSIEPFLSSIFGLREG